MGTRFCTPYQEYGFIRYYNGNGVFLVKHNGERFIMKFATKTLTELDNQKEIKKLTELDNQKEIKKLLKDDLIHILVYEEIGLGYSPHELFSGENEIKDPKCVKKFGLESYVNAEFPPECQYIKMKEAKYSLDDFLRPHDEKLLEFVEYDTNGKVVMDLETFASLLFQCVFIVHKFHSIGVCNLDISKTENFVFCDWKNGTVKYKTKDISFFIDYSRLNNQIIEAIDFDSVMFKKENMEIFEQRCNYDVEALISMIGVIENNISCEECNQFVDLAQKLKNNLSEYYNELPKVMETSEIFEILKRKPNGNIYKTIEIA